MRRLSIAVVAGFLALSGGPTQAQQSPGPAAIPAADWSAYKQKFLDGSGRIIDDGNGGISHSEGQGYGMLLSYLAGNRADFELIWSFTRTELLLRDDGLAVWKWDPKSTPHIADVNNATDGDILIAYALALAGEAWGVSEYSRTALELVQAIGRAALVKADGAIVILPGVSGFSAGDRDDGPVVNLSYWIYEAFPIFARIDKDVLWDAVSRDGMTLLRQARMGPRNLPPDWLSLAGTPKPAEGFVRRFGYESLRIPLYLVRAGVEDKDLLKSLGEGMSAPDGVVLVDPATGTVEETLADKGYRIIPALAACIAGGQAVPDELRGFEPTLYYPSTLHLLALAFLAEHPGKCR